MLSSGDHAVHVVGLAVCVYSSSVLSNAALLLRAPFLNSS